MFSPRARRYPMTAPVRFRLAGDVIWQRGRTRNLSTTGVLASAELGVLPSATPVEFVVRLTDTGQDDGPEVRCVGRVVRFEGPRDAPASMALTIDAYQFARGERWGRHDGSAERDPSADGGRTAVRAEQEIERQEI